MSDLDVDRARRGDVEAFVSLIEQRQVRMVRVASAILGNRTDADDAIQETLVSIWRELPRLRDAAQYDAWADRILVNACRLVLRRRGRSTVREIPSQAEGGPSLRDEASYGAVQSLEQSAVDREVFRRAFETLDGDARVLIVLRHLEERSIAAIAVLLGVAEGTAKSRLFTARRKLEAALEREERE